MQLNMMLLLELIVRSLIALLLIFHMVRLLLELLLRFLRTLQLMIMVHPILLLMKLSASGLDSAAQEVPVTVSVANSECLSSGKQQLSA